MANDSSGHLNRGMSVRKGASLSFALPLPKPLSANLFQVQMPTPSDTFSPIPPQLLLLLGHDFIHLCPSGTEMKEIIEFSHWPISPKPGTWLFLFPFSPLSFSGSDFEPSPCTLPHFLKKSENPCQDLPLAKDLSSEQAANLFPWQKAEAIPYDIPPITQPGHRAASMSAGGGHHICKQKLLPCRKRFPPTLLVTSEKGKQNDAFGSGGRVGGGLDGAAFSSFKGREAEAQKGQRAMIRLLEGVSGAAGTRGLRACPIY